MLYVYIVVVVCLTVGCIASLQMVSGFSRLLAAADDLVLDIPEAVHLLSLFLGR